jgi:hypothetical protein
MEPQEQAAHDDRQPADPLVARLWQSMREHDEHANLSQWRRYTFALAVAALTPFAVLFLALQVLVYPTGGVEAALLIGAELLLVATALALPLMKVGQSHSRWIEARLRAELLRRETFLLRMRVGPYLGIASATELQHIADLRLLELESVDPVSQLPCAIASGHRPWSAELEEQWRRGTDLAVPSLAECIAQYLHERVANQRRWFERKAIEKKATAKRWENAARLVLVLALVVAALHLGGLLRGGHHALGAFDQALFLAAIGLPTLGAALVGLLSITGSHRLAKGYHQTREALLHIERELRELQNHVRNGGGEKEHALALKRLVLRCEEILSADLRQWWLIMLPETPRAL